MAVFCGVLDQIPYFEDGDSVTYNNEKEGIIECLKRNVGGDLDSEVSSLPDWIPTKVMATTCLFVSLFVGCHTGNWKEDWCHSLKNLSQDERCLEESVEKKRKIDKA